MMRVAILHDHIAQKGGAERVLLAIAQTFPGAPIYTGVYEPSQSYPEFENLDVRPLWPSRSSFFRRDPRRALPVMGTAFTRARLDAADVVVCSSSGWSHRVRTSARKVVYCYNPPRWLYQADDYLPKVPGAVERGYKAWSRWSAQRDRRAALSAKKYLAISSVVAARIRSAYDIDPEVVFPPITLGVGEEEPFPGLEPGYFLTVGRPRTYKNIDLSCLAVESLQDARLVVVGALPEMPGTAGWSDRIRAVQDVSDAQMRWLYRNARAVLAMSNEDFGLTPLEGNALGAPAIAVAAGGFLDTVQPGVTGEFVSDFSAEVLAARLRNFDPSRYDATSLTDNAARFSPEAFRQRLESAVLKV